MDIMRAMQAMQNPQAVLIQYAMQGLIAQHPAEWQQVQETFNGKSRKEQIMALRKLYKTKGLDLDSMARQYGVTL